MFSRLHVLPLGSERGDSLLDLWTQWSSYFSRYPVSILHNVSRRLWRQEPGVSVIIHNIMAMLVCHWLRNNWVQLCFVSIRAWCLARRLAADIKRMQIASRAALVMMRATPLLLLLLYSYVRTAGRFEILSLPRTAPPYGIEGVGKGLR